LCVLYAGGGVEFFQSANSLSIWKRLAIEGKKKEGRYLSIFMGVPTGKIIYYSYLYLYI
jgi:hypothetical protein